MEPPNSPSRGIPFLPKGAEPCVWMAAGLVAYKLCDHDFLCEGCPFDAAMLGAASRNPDEERLPLPPAPEEFPDDRRYDPSHSWAGAIGGRRIRVGLDGFAARLLGHLTGVILPPLGSLLCRGRIACWIQDEACTVSLRSPVTGPVVRINRRLLRYPGLLAESPFRSGWLFEAACEDVEATLEPLLPAAEMRRITAADSRELRETASRLAASADDGVGPTLADGGEPVADLHRALGPPRYYALVGRLLS